ncbi:MAG: oligosaccharide flippase family protein [Planctomycetes bacterium]|nr:oligosaccharide flippase family protein [Planctomycetota bacterium]
MKSGFAACETRKRPTARHLSPLTLRVNFYLALASNSIYALAQLAALAIIARLTSASEVGAYAFALAVVTPVFMFANLSLKSIQAADVTKEHPFEDYFTLRVIVTLVAALLIICAAPLAAYSLHVCGLILIVGLWKALEAIGEVFHGLAQQMERWDRICISVMLKWVLGVAALFAILAATGNMALGLAAIVTLAFCVLLFYDTRNKWLLQPDRGYICREPARILHLARAGVLVGVATGCNSLYMNLPRYFINSSHGQRELGFYAALAQLALAGSICVGALAQSSTTQLARRYQTGDRRGFVRLIVRVLALGGLVGVAGVVITIAFGRELLTLIYGQQYAPYAWLFPYLMVAAAVDQIGALLSYDLTATQYYRSRPLPFMLIYVGQTLLTLLLCLLLVPSHGLKGAVMAIIVSASVGLVGKILAALDAVRSISVPLPSTP